MSKSRYGFSEHTKARTTYNAVKSSILAKEIAAKQKTLAVYDIPAMEKEVTLLQRTLKDTLLADVPFSEMQEWCY